MGLAIAYKSPISSTQPPAIQSLRNPKRRLIEAGFSSIKSPPLCSAVSQVFAIMALRYHIFSYLRFREVGLAERVSCEWRGDEHPGLVHYHKNRRTLSVPTEGEDLLRAYRSQNPQSHCATVIWEEIFTLARFPQLTRLNLSEPEDEAYMPFLESSVQTPYVHTLTLSRSHLTEAHLLLLLQKLPSLHTLKLKKCYNIDQTAVLSLAVRGSSLISLNLAECPGINEATLQAIAAVCTQLKHLDLSWCPKVNKKGIKFLSKGCSSLTSLHLKGNSEEKKYSKLIFHQLKTLNLSWSRGLNKSGIESLAKGCSSLTSLDVSFSSLNTASLRALTSMFSQLKALNLSGNSKVDHKDGSIWGSRSNALTFLDLSHCQGFDDQNLQIFTNACPQPISLIQMNVSYSKVTEAAIRILVHACSSLQFLNLSYCPQIEKSLTSSLEVEFPHVKILCNEIL